MPAYKSQFLREAIESIVNQKYDNWELVVVDDCSPDNLQSIVREYEDPRIRYMRNESNIGGKDLVAQWNHSITFARGEWVILAADDDVYCPDFCESVSALAECYHEIDLIRSRVEVIDKNSDYRWNDREFPEFSSCYEYLNNWLSGKVFTCIGNYVFRREALLNAGGFVNFPHAFCSDQATPIQLAEKGVANTKNLCFKFRESGTNLSGSKLYLKDKLTAMMEFYDWLDGFEYPAPDNEKDAQLYSIKNSRHLHGKCIYDCFNHAIAFCRLRELPSFLRMCRVAGFQEKAMMAARWAKRKIFVGAR